MSVLPSAPWGVSGGSLTRHRYDVDDGRLGPAERGREPRARLAVGALSRVCACPRAVTDRKCVCAVVCGVWTHGARARRCATKDELLMGHNPHALK